MGSSGVLTKRIEEAKKVRPRGPDLESIDLRRDARSDQLLVVAKSG